MVACCLKGTYLGFSVGPSKEDSSWDKALKKYADRAVTWGAIHQGLHIGIYAYNTYVVSVLSYLAQLEQPPEKSHRIEKATLRTIALRLGNWVSQEDI